MWWLVFEPVYSARPRTLECIVIDFGERNGLQPGERNLLWGGDGRVSVSGERRQKRGGTHASLPFAR